MILPMFRGELQAIRAKKTIDINYMVLQLELEINKRKVHFEEFKINYNEFEGSAI